MGTNAVTKCAQMPTAHNAAYRPHCHGRCPARAVKNIEVAKAEKQIIML